MKWDRVFIIANGILIAVFISLIALSSPYLTLKYFTPLTNYNYYETIISHVHEVGKPLEFVSYRSINNPSTMVSQEDLICPVNGVMKQVVERESKYIPAKTDGLEYSLPWIFPYIPTETGTCILEAYITQDLPLGVKRSQLLITDVIIQ